jgi:hypothetical protein
LGEVLIAFGLLALVFAGLIYGYGQTNRMAEWSSMSLAAQSYASQGAELARAAIYDPRNLQDQLPAPFTNSTFDIMDVPCKGDPTNTDTAFWVTNIVHITDVNSNINPPLRLIRSDCVWRFPLTGQMQTNTVILLRTSDQ